MRCEGNVWKRNIDVDVQWEKKERKTDVVRSYKKKKGIDYGTAGQEIQI